MDDLVSGSLMERGAHKADPRYEGGGTTMWVRVYSPVKIYFDEPATSISAANTTGPFDILPHHHNFITLLEPCELAIARPGKMEPQRIKISGGVMHVKADRVAVFLDV